MLLLFAHDVNHDLKVVPLGLNPLRYFVHVLGVEVLNYINFNLLDKNAKIGIRLDLSYKQNQRIGIKINEIDSIHNILDKTNNKIHP